MRRWFATNLDEPPRNQLHVMVNGLDCKPNEVPLRKRSRQLALTTCVIIGAIIFVVHPESQNLSSYESSNSRTPGISFHNCVGSRKETRSCIFYNLYFEIESSKFLYYVQHNSHIDFPGGGDAGRSLSKGVRKFGKGYTDNGFLFLHAGGRRGKSQRDRSWYEPWQVQKMISQPPPLERVHTMAGTQLLWESIAPSSFGHTLVDNVVPIFIVLSTFDLDVSEVQIVMMATCEEHLPEMNNTSALKWCANLRRHGGLFSPALTSKEVIEFTKLVNLAKLSGKDKLHFPQVVVGGGGLAMWLQLQKAEYHAKYADPGRRDSRAYGAYFWKLHQHFYSQLDTLHKCCSIPKQPKIIILDKHGSRGGSEVLGERKILNIDSVVNWLRDSFPRARVDKVNMQQFTWTEQLHMLASTSVFISPFGSVSFRCLFLPKGSYAIILGLPGNRVDANWESDAWLRYQSYVGILNYAVDTNELATNSSKESVQEESDVFMDRSKIIHLVRQAFELQTLAASVGIQ